jgi:hypothetical protein
VGKYAGSRGKCKHVIAAGLARRGEPATRPDDEETEAPA